MDDRSPVRSLRRWWHRRRLDTLLTRYETLRWALERVDYPDDVDLLAGHFRRTCDELGRRGWWRALDAWMGEPRMEHEGKLYPSPVDPAVARRKAFAAAGLALLAALSLSLASPAWAQPAASCSETVGEALFRAGFTRSLHNCYTAADPTWRKCTAPFRPQEASVHLRYGYDDLAARGIGSAGGAVLERAKLSSLIDFLRAALCPDAWESMRLAVAGGTPPPEDRFAWGDVSYATRDGKRAAFDVLAAAAPTTGGGGAADCPPGAWSCSLPTDEMREWCATQARPDWCRGVGIAPDDPRCLLDHRARSHPRLYYNEDRPECDPTGAPLPEPCGDGACILPESSATCPVDCPPPPPPDPCGDGTCDEDGGESFVTCPADCPAEPADPDCFRIVCPAVHCPECPPAPPPDECDAALDTFRGALEGGDAAAVLRAAAEAAEVCE